MDDELWFVQLAILAKPLTTLSSSRADAQHARGAPELDGRVAIAPRHDEFDFPIHYLN